MKSENKNFLYNVIYQIFIYIIPILTTPYISRVLGADNVGIYSYTYSIVYYFMLLSMLGINNYASRKIARNERNKKNLNKTFSSIYFLQLILNVVCIISYLILCFFIQYDNKIIMYIQFIYLISAGFDINWLYFGLEKFKITISRNVIIKLLSMILVFILVKKSSDLWIYTLIMSGSTLISQLYLWLFLNKEVSFTRVSLKEIFHNLKPCLILFVPVISYGVYRVMDKTMLGYFSTNFELGNFESAEKIINIPISFITALGTVMLPHMSKMKEEEIINKNYESFKLTYFIIFPILIGLLIISDDFSLLFFGPEFTKAADLIRLLSISIIFTATANVIRTGFLIPTKRDYIYVKSTIFGAIINLIININFIPRYGATGAGIGTIAAEFTVMLYQIIATKNIVNYFEVFKIGIPFFIQSIIIGVFISFIGNMINTTFTKIIVQIIIAIIIYVMINHNYIIYDFFGRQKIRKDLTL